MDGSSQERLSECYRLLDESGDVEDCLARYPELADEIQAYAGVRRFVLDRLPDGPDPHALAAGRALLSAAAAGPHGGLRMLPGLSLSRLAAAFAGLVLVGGAVVGAAAATDGAGLPGPVNRALSSVGITDRADESAATPAAELPAAGAESTAAATPGAHGDAVSDAVHTAIAGTTPGPGRGDAVSDAACAAAHDRSNLPEGAQNAPGQQDRTPSACDHGAGDDSAAGATPAPTDTPPAGEPDARPGNGPGAGNQGHDQTPPRGRPR